jgi:hypothetical protein
MPRDYHVDGRTLLSDVNLAIRVVNLKVVACLRHDAKIGGDRSADIRPFPGNFSRRKPSAVSAKEAHVSSHLLGVTGSCMTPHSRSMAVIIRHAHARAVIKVQIPTQVFFVSAQRD